MLWATLVLICASLIVSLKDVEFAPQLFHRCLGARSMAREMRDDAGLQLLVDGSGAGLEPVPQQPGQQPPNATSSKVGNFVELEQPDAAYNHPQYIKSDADYSRAYDRTTIPAPKRTLTRRLRWMIGAVVLLLVVIIAVLGGVLGSRAHSASAAAASPTASAPNASSINSNTGLTAVAWQDSDSVLQYRVYYQSTRGEIRERAWNNTQHSWYTLNNKIGPAKKGSPLVAAVKASSAVSSVIDTNISPPMLKERSQGHGHQPLLPGRFGASQRNGNHRRGELAKWILEHPQDLPGVIVQVGSHMVPNHACQ